MENEDQNLFRSPTEMKSDCRLVERALRAGWLSPERRAAMQKLLWTKAEECAENSWLKEFHAFAVLLEKMYEFDVKLAEREEVREMNRNQPLAPKPVVVVETGGTIEQQRQRLLERIRTARGAGGGP